MTKVNGGVFESPLCNEETLKNNVHLGNGVKFEVDESGNVVITEAEERKNGVTYSINGLEIGAIEKIWYEFDQIETELLTAEAPESK